MEIMSICTKRTKEIVTEKKELIHQLAQKLLELETIDQNVIEGILGARPFKLSKQHEEYIKEKKKLSEEIKDMNSKEKVGEANMKRSDYVL